MAPPSPTKPPVVDTSIPDWYKGFICTRYAEENNYDAPSVEEYVRRSPEERIKAAKQPNGGRAQNAFILYRTIYKELICKRFGNLKQNNLSQAAGYSWKREDTAFREAYREWAEIEKRNHVKTFGDEKYCPKKRKDGTGGRKSASARKVVAPIKATKASKMAERRHHLRPPPRSPEPTYYPIEGTPAGEVPSLSSYQGTPLASSVTTPQPLHAHLLHMDNLETFYGQAVCDLHLPYGRTQTSYAQWASPSQHLAQSANNCYNGEYPDPTMLDNPFDYLNYGQHHATVQIPSDFPYVPTITADRPSQLVGRDTNLSSGSSLNPHDISLVQLHEPYDGNTPEAGAITIPQEHNSGDAEFITDERFTYYLQGGDYLQGCSDWAADNAI